MNARPIVLLTMDVGPEISSIFEQAGYLVIFVKDPKQVTVRSADITDFVAEADVQALRRTIVERRYSADDHVVLESLTKRLSDALGIE